MKKENQKSQIVIYKTETGETKIDVRFDGETVWLTQNALAELFQTTKQNISQHIKNIFEELELKPNATVKNFFTVQNEGSREVSRKLEYYNLDLLTKEKISIYVQKVNYHRHYYYPIYCGRYCVVYKNVSPCQSVSGYNQF